MVALYYKQMVWYIGIYTKDYTSTIVDFTDEGCGVRKKRILLNRVICFIGMLKF